MNKLVLVASDSRKKITNAPGCCRPRGRVGPSPSRGRSCLRLHHVASSGKRFSLIFPSRFYLGAAPKAASAVAPATTFASSSSSSSRSFSLPLCVCVWDTHELRLKRSWGAAGQGGKKSHFPKPATRSCIPPHPPHWFHKAGHISLPTPAPTPHIPSFLSD